MYKHYGVDLNFDKFNISDLINNTNSSSTLASTISLNSKNSFYKSVLNKYWGAIYSKAYNYETKGDVIAYDLKNWRDHSYSTRRADTIYSENFKTGDILIYKNTNDVTYTYEKNKLNKNYVTDENGEYAYIYIEGKGFVGINYGADKTKGTKDDRNSFTYDYYSDKGLSLFSVQETNKSLLEFFNYQTLLGKDSYVILRPTLGFDVVPMRVWVTYKDIAFESTTVEISSSEEMIGLEGWTLSNNNKVLTKTYKEDKEEIIEVMDLGGHKTSTKISVTIPKRPEIELKINYSTLEKTKDNVVVTIVANEAIEPVTGWTLSNDKTKLVKSYEENKTEIIEVSNALGNKREVIIVVKNIDKTPPETSIHYSTQEVTNTDVIVEITANEKIRAATGWVLLNGENTLTKTFSSNSEEIVVIEDDLGNKTINEVKIDNIDKEAPSAIVIYKSPSQESEKISVTIAANENIEEIEGWTLSNNNKVLTKEIEKEELEEMVIEDRAGNNISLEIDASSLTKVMENKKPSEDSKMEDLIVVVDQKGNDITEQLEISNKDGNLVIKNNGVRIYSEVEEIEDKNNANSKYILITTSIIITIGLMVSAIIFIKKRNSKK